MPTLLKSKFDKSEAKIKPRDLFPLRPSHFSIKPQHVSISSHENRCSRLRTQYLHPSQNHIKVLRGRDKHLDPQIQKKIRPDMPAKFDNVNVTSVTDVDNRVKNTAGGALYYNGWSRTTFAIVGVSLEPPSMPNAITFDIDRGSRRPVHHLSDEFQHSKFRPEIRLVRLCGYEQRPRRYELYCCRDREDVWHRWWVRGEVLLRSGGTPGG